MHEYAGSDKILQETDQVDSGMNNNMYWTYTRISETGQSSAVAAVTGQSSWSKVAVGDGKCLRTFYGGVDWLDWIIGSVQQTDRTGLTCGGWKLQVTSALCNNIE